MKYLLTFYGHEDVEPSPEEMQEGMDRWNAFENEAVDSGVLIACEPLEGSETATTIRLPEDGDATTTDGPFAESKEQLGGFLLIECKDRDEALEWAAKVPLRAGAGLEVRAVRDLSQFGRKSPTPSPVKGKVVA